MAVLAASILVIVQLLTVSCVQYGPAPQLTENGVAVNITDEAVTDLMIFPDPLPFYMFMYHGAVANFTYSIVCDSFDRFYELHVFTEMPDVAFLSQPGLFNLTCEDMEGGFPHPRRDAMIVSGTFNISLQSDLLGRTWLYIDSPSVNITSESNSTNDGSDKEIGHFRLRMMITVVRALRALDTVVQIVAYVFIVTSTIGMGCSTDLDVIKEVLKRPIAPIIGFVCQYLGMPLIAFGVAKLVKFENPAVGLGIFACGFCPGGGPSNIYTYLLGGDLSLSVTMTTISTIAALGMVPLWMFTLGKQFHDDKMQITIPYLSIVQTLATVILPLLVGIFIKYKCQKLAAIIMKVIKPVTLVTVALLLGFGIYANLYIFRLFKPPTLLAGCMLPYIGYVIGGLIALTCRQPWYRVKTIAIETGIQNVMVAYLMLLMALPPPDGDLAAVGPAASACMTPLPLFVLAIGYTIYLKCTNQSYAHVQGGDTEIDANGNARPGGSTQRGKDKENGVKADMLASGDSQVVDKLTAV
ncbi:ileal sodium/bile acid cotransporter-like [Haliotis cracherodii]|uniref:ileal sodium/bile acid cotransporter-like n=1 Tax=Haliotis cracherodii TaxID=6455 RepID=UPI0039EA25B0